MNRFKELFTESANIDDMYEQIAMLDGKGAQIAWDWFEDNLGDSGIYAGDATPDDYLDVMTDKQIKTLYKIIDRKKLFTESKKQHCPECSAELDKKDIKKLKCWSCGADLTKYYTKKYQYSQG